MVECSSCVRHKWVHFRVWRRSCWIGIKRMTRMKGIVDESLFFRTIPPFLEGRRRGARNFEPANKPIKSCFWTIEGMSQTSLFIQTSPAAGSVDWPSLVSSFSYTHTLFSHPLVLTLYGRIKLRFLPCLTLLYRMPNETPPSGRPTMTTRWRRIEFENWKQASKSASLLV